LSSRDRELRPTPIVIISFSQARGQQAFAGRSVSPSRSTARWWRHSRPTFGSATTSWSA